MARGGRFQAEALDDNAHRTCCASCEDAILDGNNAATCITVSLVQMGCVCGGWRQP